jgi:hypothetical protein
MSRLPYLRHDDLDASFLLNAFAVPLPPGATPAWADSSAE